MMTFPTRTTSALVVMSVAWLASTALLVGQAAAVPRTVWDKVYTEDQAKRGAAAYKENCSPCHGEDLMGGGNAPALVDEDFMFSWSDQSLGALFERIQTLMPSDRPNSLAPDMYRDIVTFILKSNKFPAGDTELGTDADALKQIKITKAHP